MIVRLNLSTSRPRLPSRRSLRYSSNCRLAKKKKKVRYCAICLYEATMKIPTLSRLTYRSIVSKWKMFWRCLDEIVKVIEPRRLRGCRGRVARTAAHVSPPRGP
ncbi:hypothetical protein EVAR_43491_1 [Eumeta japonica]|uniref:Uncharacterized protein n=1 Tax=Eumeta variegata TaxID=151549 RepID=A0A4C1YML8_EUMVA|nr:hypothetical protein EVAR_43491_1 [Eumeta japonica]